MRSVGRCLILLAAPMAAQVTQPTGYHIVVTPPGETLRHPGIIHCLHDERRQKGPSPAQPR
jgi:hypothetical protein